MAAPTFFGYGTNPADNSSLQEPQTGASLTPPSSMATGDLVVVIAYGENQSSGDITMNNNGGQTWTTDTTSGSYEYAGPAALHKIWWCQFNGTWSANPSFNFAAQTGNRFVGVQMLVFRPDSGSKVWALDASPVWADYAAPGGSNPFPVPVTGWTPAHSDTVSIIRWTSDDDNTWGGPVSPWTGPGIQQFRNLAGNDFSVSFWLQYLGTAAALGDATNYQTANGPDGGSTLKISFYSYASATYTLTASGTSFTETGISAGLKASRKLASGTGSFTFTGNATAFSKGRTLTAAVGSFTLTGNATALKASRKMLAATTAFSITGNVTGLPVSRKMPSDVGVFAVTGNGTAFKVSRNLIAGNAAFDLVGNDAVLTYTPSGPTYTITMTVGDFVLAGVDAGLKSSRNLVAAPGSFTLTGIDAAFKASRVLVIDPASFTLTGVASGLKAERRLAADAGSFAITGYDTAFVYTPVGGPTYTIAVTSGAFTLTGIDSAFKAARVLVSDPASYLLTGYDAAFTYTPATEAVTRNTGGWIDPATARRLLREAKAYQKAAERKRQDEQDRLEARKAALHATMERAYAEITGEALPAPETLNERLNEPQPEAPNRAAADAIAVYMAVLEMNDQGAMQAALEAMDQAFMRMRIEMAERDDEEAILLLI